MKIIKTLIDILASSKITYILLNFLGILLIGVLLIANAPIIDNILSTVWEISRPFIFGLAIAFVLETAIFRLEKKINNRKVAITIVYLSVLLFIIALVVLMIPMLYNSISDLIPSLNSGLNEIEAFVLEQFNFDISTLTVHIESLIMDYFSNSFIINSTLDVLLSIIGTIGNIMIYVVLAVYTSFNYEKIRTFVTYFFSKVSNTLPSYLIQIEYSLSLYIQAFLLDAIVQGISIGVIYLVIGQPNWILLGVISGVSSIIPYVGPIFANIVGIVTCLSMGSSSLIILCILIFIQSSTIQYIVTPRIYSSQVDLGIFTVLFGIISGATLFGAWGMIIAMPLLVSIKIIYKLYRENKQN